MLPNLIVIGAQKGGTSSLHRYLDLHPEIAMASPRELNFFCGPGWSWDRGLDWYGSHFDGAASVRGESSPDYTFFPYIRGVPERMHAVAPEARLLYVVRDPVERMISQYLHYWSRGYERRPIDEVFSDPRFHGSGYVARSRYHAQLERYLEHFPRSSLLVLSQEELLGDRDRALTRVFGFLGVDPSFRSPAFAELHNTARDHRRQRALQRRVETALRPLGLARPARRVMGTRRLERLMSRPLERPRLEPALRERVTDLVRDDAARLRRLTGERFDAWSV
jgi:hypothetical protein